MGKVRLHVYNISVTLEQLPVGTFVVGVVVAVGMGVRGVAVIIIRLGNFVIAVEMERV